MHEGNIKNNLKEFKNWVVCSTDPFMGIIIGVNKEGEITVLERNTDKDVWKLKTKLKINCKAEVIGIGIVPC